MDHPLPPRRAVLVADNEGRYRKLGRSAAWPAEGAALAALALLDDGTGEVRPYEVAGFMRHGPGEWVVVRGAPLRAQGEQPARYWRDGAVFDDPTFAGQRRNPFRLMASGPPELPEAPFFELPDATPEPVTAEEDVHRLRTLHRATLPTRAAGQLEDVLAAMLESDHTVVAGRELTPDHVELVLLLLPPSLRGELTFRVGLPATDDAVPPRLVLAPELGVRAPDVGDDRGRWGHRLPHTRGLISAGARAIARTLIDLLDTPESLVSAHEAYERYARGRRDEAPLRLLEEAGAVVRLGRLAVVIGEEEPGGALRVLGEAIASRADEEHREVRHILDLVATAFSPDRLGSVVAAVLRHGQFDPAGPALVLERFLSIRRGDPSSYEAFVTALEGLSADAVAITQGEAAQRVRTLLMLLAASRNDGAGLIAAATGPVHGEIVERLGGAEQWGEEDEPVGDALLALCRLQEPRDGVAALAALDALRPELPRGYAQLRLIVAGVRCTRWSLQRYGEDKWAEAVALTESLLQLCRRVTGAARVTLDGRSDADLFRDMLNRSLRPGQGSTVSSHGDAELFLGLLGVEESPCRVATWEIPDRGEAVVAEVLERVRAEAMPGEVLTEGVHWGLTLLERVRRREVDVQHARLAIHLVTGAAGSKAGAVLRLYTEDHPEVARAILEDAAAQRTLTPADTAALGGVALDQALEESVRKIDTAPVVITCDRIRLNRLRLKPADLGPLFAKRLGALPEALRAGTPKSALRGKLETVERALAAALDDEALREARRLLGLTPPAEAAEPKPIVAPAPARAPARNRGVLPARRETAAAAEPPAAAATPPAAAASAPPAAAVSTPPPAASSIPWIADSPEPADARPAPPAAASTRRTEEPVLPVEPAAPALEERAAAREPVAKVEGESRQPTQREPAQERAREPAPPVVPPSVEPEPSFVFAWNPDRGSQQRRQKLLRAAAMVGGLALGAAGGVAVIGTVGGADAEDVPGAAPAAETQATEPAPPFPMLDASMVSAQLAQARQRSERGEWEGVVQLLSAAGAEPGVAGAFAWDSLLARAALLEAGRESLPLDRRMELLEITRDRASRALAAVGPFDPGSDALRLLRADACVSGPLRCDSATVAQDLILAMRSSARDVSQRAGELLLARTR